jgi:putative copper export protein
VQPAALARQAAGLASTEPGGSWAAALRDLLLSSRLGWLWLAQFAMLVLLRELAAGARTRQTMPAPEAILAVTAAVGLALVQALGSHAAAVRDAPLAVAYDTGHVLAAGVWVGAVAAFALAVWPVRGLARRDAAALARAARLPFAALAGVAVLVLCVTGLIAAGVQVASIDGLLTTFYGQTLLAKGGLVVVACALGAANFVLLGLLERGGRRRVVRGAIAAEAVAGLAILAGAAVLTASAPARGPQFASPRPVQAPTLSARAEDLVLTASVTPNRPGTNVFTVVAASSRRPPPAPIRSLALRVAGAPPVILRQVGEGRWLGTGTLASAGAARMTLAVDRGSSSVAPRLGWTVEPADAARAVVVSSRRLETIVRPAAILLLLGAALAAGAVLTFERARRLPEAGGPEPVFSGVEEPT